MSSRIIINFNDKNDMNNKLLVELLKQYQELITSSVGPFKSKLKFISKEDCSDSLILTNTSKNLFSCLYKINHLTQKDETKREQDSNLRQFGLVKWQFELISTVVTNAHFSHFYDNGLFLCSLVNEFLINTKGVLNESLNFDKPLSYLLFNKLIEHLVDLRSKQSSLVSIKLNLDNLNNFKNLLITCLNTKCLVEQLDDEKKDAFINLCLKAFVKSFNADFESTVSRKNKYFSEIIYLYDDTYSSHLNDSKVFDGVLFKIDSSQTENEIETMSSSKTNRLKCVLFDCSFSGDFEHLSNLDYTFDIELNEFQRNRLVFSQLDKYIDLFNILIEKFKINVVLCQKVIHPSLKLYLKKRNVIALDRLSLILTQPLADLTGEFVYLKKIES
jgi:McKusick-Kaufman syndrome protein